jgi:restriction system protein
MDFLSRYESYREFRARSAASVASSDVVPPGSDDARTAEPPVATQTPEERALSAALEIEAALRTDLLARLKGNDPGFFERVVLDVLKALGYGAGSGGLSEHTGGPGDGGIDGVIDEDRLGLDRLYVQAKRYGDQPVGPTVIQAFIGALQMKGASKGVLITTSRFSTNAINAARSIPSMRIVLIDGDRLAELMIRHGVGVRTDRTIELRKLDLDYFEPDDA